MPKSTLTLIDETTLKERYPQFLIDACGIETLAALPVVNSSKKIIHFEKTIDPNGCESCHYRYEPLSLDELEGHNAICGVDISGTPFISYVNQFGIYTVFQSKHFLDWKMIKTQGILLVEGQYEPQISKDRLAHNVKTGLALALNQQDTLPVADRMEDKASGNSQLLTPQVVEATLQILKEIEKEYPPVVFWALSPQTISRLPVLKGVPALKRETEILEYSPITRSQMGPYKAIRGTDVNGARFFSYVNPHCDHKIFTLFEWSYSTNTYWAQIREDEPTKSTLFYPGNMPWGLYLIAQIVERPLEFEALSRDCMEVERRPAVLYQYTPDAEPKKGDVDSRPQAQVNTAKAADKRECRIS